MIPCWEKKKIAKVAIDDLMSKVTGFITTCVRRNTQKTILSPSFPPPPSPLAALPFPSSLSFFLAPTVCIPSFYNFLFSLAARQIASRSMNFLERSCDCLSMFLLPPLFFSPSFFSLLTFTLLSLLFFLNPCNVGHSSWEAKSGENRAPPATRHLYINHVRFEHHEFVQNPFFFFYIKCTSLISRYDLSFSRYFELYYIFSRSFIDRN